MTPAPSPTFESAYGHRIPQWLHVRLRDLGFHHPTPVQAAVLPVALPTASKKGSDVVIHAQTGSGKTLAYLLPTIASVDPTRACTQALIVVPTQELGMQVYKLLRRVVSSFAHDSASQPHDVPHQTSDDSQLSFPVLPMLDQADFRKQKLQMRQTAPRIIIGNPLRIASLVEAGRLRLDLLKVLVVDEFDACLLDTDTVRALQTILSVRGRVETRQTILASATVPQHRHFLRQCVQQRWTEPDIKHVWVEQDTGERLPMSLSHSYAICDAKKKLAALRALLVNFSRQNGASEEDGGLRLKAIVFVMASRNIGTLVEALNRSLDEYFGMENCNLVVGLTNDMAIINRREVMERFRSGEARVLIGTDLAARGLDVPDVTHVFHFDLPTDPDAYLHRSGRAGRQGRQGNSVVLITRGERFVISRTSNALGIEFGRIGQ